MVLMKRSGRKVGPRLVALVLILIAIVAGIVVAELDPAILSPPSSEPAIDLVSYSIPSTSVATGSANNLFAVISCNDTQGSATTGQMAYVEFKNVGTGVGFITTVMIVWRGFTFVASPTSCSLGAPGSATFVHFEIESSVSNGPQEGDSLSLQTTLNNGQSVGYSGIFSQGSGQTVVTFTSTVTSHPVTTSLSSANETTSK